MPLVPIGEIFFWTKFPYWENIKPKFILKLDCSRWYTIANTRFFTCSWSSLLSLGFIVFVSMIKRSLKSLCAFEFTQQMFKADIFRTKILARYLIRVIKHTHKHTFLKYGLKAFELGMGSPKIFSMQHF